MEVAVEILDTTDLRTLKDDVDRWLEDLVDDAVDYGARRLRVHAPGGIDELVVSDGPRFELDVGAFEGVAGVLADVREEIDNPRGLGSSPADYPLYVDIGTGIYGDIGLPITAFGGAMMGPIEYGGRMIYIKSSKGQRPQLYSDRSAEDTDTWLDQRIVTSLPGLVRRA